jgi:membrane-associated phospholipid phosphatase
MSAVRARPRGEASLGAMRSLPVQLGACVALGALIRVAAYDIGPVQRADVKLLEHITRPADRIHHVSEVLVTPFDAGAYLVIVAIVLIAAVLGGRRREGLIAVGAMAGAAITTQVLKNLLAEPRPEAASLLLPPNAWPSGHATAAAALAIGVVLITPPARREPVAIIAAVCVAVIGVALLILGRHYPSDVAGGICVAGAWGVIAFHLTSRRAQPAAP